MNVCFVNNEMATRQTNDNIIIANFSQFLDCDEPMMSSNEYFRFWIPKLA